MRRLTLLLAVALVAGCGASTGSKTTPPPANEVVGRADTGSASLTEVVINGHPCVVAHTTQGDVALDCDWSAGATR